MFILSKSLFCLVALFTTFSGFGQDLNRHNWFFSGNNQAIVFGKDSESNPVLLSGKTAQNNIGEKVTATDQISGDLIFYSDGVNIYDGTYQVMPNGDNIDFDPLGLQALATSPIPGNDSDSLYYIFHRNPAGEILYTLIDRRVQGNRLDGPPSGAVDINQKNRSTGITDRGDGLITIGSSDLSTYWIISQNASTGTFEIHEIPRPGLPFTVAGTMNLTNPITAAHFSYHEGTGQIAITPSNNANIEIALFADGGNINPVLTSSRTVLNSFVFGETYGGSVGWSYTGRFLYFGRNNGTNGNIYRFDAFSTLAEGTVEQVLDNPVTESFSLQLAPDSLVYNIYTNAPSGERLLRRIDNADLTDLEDLEIEEELFENLDVESTYFSQFNPSAAFRPQVEIASQEGDLCMNNPIQFFPVLNPATSIPNAYFWDFQGAGVTSELQAPVVTFEQGGAITANLDVLINGLFYPTQVPLNVLENDIQVSLPDTTICAGETLTLNAKPEGGGQGQQGGAGGGPFEYLWSTGETEATIDVTEAGDYWVVITPTTGCPIYATANVEVYADESTSANIWYFGNGAGLDFNEVEGLDPPPRSITARHAMDAPEGTSTISDSNGDVLFYSNGTSVWNRENNVMPNGNQVGGDSTSTQSVIILPFINDETLYYVFTTQEVYGEGSFEIRYSIVDMKGDNGRGDVIIKDVVLFNNSTEKIAAFEGGNGYWLLTHEYGNNTFRAYPVFEDGIGLPTVSSEGGILSYNDPLSGQAGMKFSQDGSRIANAVIDGGNDYVELFDFDIETGEITEFNYRIDLNEGISASDEVYDIHFSTGGIKLFATLNNRNLGNPGGRILEYRVDSLSTEASRLASRVDITELAGINVNYGQIQTGPNGALYVAFETPGNPSGSAFVSQIAANEDTLNASGFSAQAVALTVGNSRLGLPNFVQNNANPQQEPSMSVVDVNCVEERVSLTGTGTSDIDEYLWTITNQADNSTVFSVAAQDTAYTFTADQEGIYNVSFNISNRCGFDTTLVQELQVFGIPDPPTVPAAVSVCANSSFEFEAGPADTNLDYEWTNSQGVVVSTNRSYAITEPEIYTITITNNVAGCSSSGTVFAGPPFEIELPDARTICEGEELTLDPNVTANNYIWTVIDENGNISGPLANQRRATVDSSVPGIFDYVVSIEDPISAGCFVNDTTRVTINPLAQGAASNIVNTACNTSNGSFDIDITTTGSYNYTITGASSGVVGTSNDFIGPGTIPVTGLAADIYSIQITDNGSGCSNTIGDIQVQNDPPDFTISAVNIGPADCSASTGSITATLSADVFPISYVLTNADDGTSVSGNVAGEIPTTSFDFEISGLEAATYNLEVTSSTGCIQSETGIVISEPIPVDFTTEPFVEICGANATLTVNNNTPGASFTWSGPSGFSDTGETITVTQSGTFTVIGSLAGSCDLSRTVEVDFSIQPTVQIVPEGNVCQGQVTLVAQITNPVAGATYAFTWSNGFNAQRITVDASGTYSVIARNTENLTCEGTDTEDVLIPDPLVGSISSDPACDDGSDTLSPITLTSTTSGGGGPITVTWERTNDAGDRDSNGNLITTVVGTGQTINVDAEGSYIAIISDGICSIRRSILVRRQRVPKGELPEVEYYCSTRSDNPILLAGRGFETYEWTLDGVPYPDVGQTLEVQAPGEYVVVMTTSVGCVRTDTVTILESCDPQVIAPNVFSPTSNPPNNTFSVVPNDFVSEFEIYIYSRWGELLFQSNTLEFKWDGVYNGQLVPLGTYPYVIRFTSRFEPERGVFEQRGSVTVIR